MDHLRNSPTLHLWPIVAKGIGGIKSDQLISRHKQTINSELQRFDEVIIHVGSNDISRGISTNKLIANVDMAGQRPQEMKHDVKITLSSIFLQGYDPPKNVLTKIDNRRCLEGNCANFFYKILHEHNPYCCWSFKYNRVRGKNFKGNVPCFKIKAICTITGCKSAVYITVRDSESSTVHLQFSGEVHHPSGVIASRRITCDERKRL